MDGDDITFGGAGLLTEAVLGGGAGVDDGVDLGVPNDIEGNGGVATVAVGLLTDGAAAC